jgi:hypothetical protein
MRYAFSGSRHQKDSYIPQLLLYGMMFWQRQTKEKTTIICGDATGVDSTVEVIAKDLGFDCNKFVADWGAKGNKAGPLRNQRMINEGDPKVGFCIKNDFGKNRYPNGRMKGGTEDFARRCIEADIPVFLIKQLTLKDVT